MQLRTASTRHLGLYHRRLPTSGLVSMADHVSTCGSTARVLADMETRNEGQKRLFYVPKMPAHFAD